MSARIWLISFARSLSVGLVSLRRSIRLSRAVAFSVLGIGLGCWTLNLPACHGNGGGSFLWRFSYPRLGSRSFSV